MKKFKEHFEIITFVLALVFAAGGMYWQSQAYGQRLDAVEATQKAYSEKKDTQDSQTKTDIEVIKNDISWIKRKLGG